MTHVNAPEHMKTYLEKNRPAWNAYYLIKTRQYRAWKKISMEFLRILL